MRGKFSSFFLYQDEINHGICKHILIIDKDMEAIGYIQINTSFFRLQWENWL